MRGYPSQDFLADNAIKQNFELVFPIYFIPEDYRLPYDFRALRDSLSGLIFFDYSWGATRSGDDSPLTSEANFSCFGTGIELDIYDQFSIRFLWGFQIDDPSTSDPRDSRFHLSIDLENQLPTLMERIREESLKEHIKHQAWRIIEEKIEKRTRYQEKSREKIIRRQSF